MRKFSGSRILVATGNQGKLEEISALLEPFGVTSVSLADLELAEPAETETSFVGNARIKAHAAAKATGIPALADDSGLTLDALGGAPGIYTADWSETGLGRDFDVAMTKTSALLDAVSAVPPRRAQFLCTLVLAWPDGHDEVFDGVVEGAVVWPQRGRSGHGYDPIFVPMGYDETFGEMDRVTKNSISHRAMAFDKLVTGCFT